MTESIQQREFTNTLPSIINPNLPHMAIAFVLDTSGSMAGDPIKELNNGLNRFKEITVADSDTKAIVDVAIIEFNTDVKLLQDFRPIEQMMNMNLTATGVTNMSGAIEMALNLVDERSKFYIRCGSQPYKPWVILITDGFASGLEKVTERIKQMERDDKVSFRSLGCGDYNSEMLHMLSGKKVMKLSGTNFTDFFNWVYKSMRSVSVTSPGERPEAIRLEGNVVKDVSDTSDWG